MDNAKIRMTIPKTEVLERPCAYKNRPRRTQDRTCGTFAGDFYRESKKQKGILSS
jgi:hypothetical protein